MAVTDFDEIHRGRGGSDQIKGRAVHMQYVRVFRAKTNSNDDEAETVLTYKDCPLLGSPYQQNMKARCIKRTARNETFSKRVWIVSCTYDTEREWKENPLQDPVQITWNTEQFQSIAVEDKDGNAVLNSAGDGFDPPAEKDDSRWSVMVQKNVDAVPSWILNYRDAVNSNAFGLDGIAVGVRQAKMQAITIGPWQFRNDIAFRVLTLKIQLRGSWLLKLLNAGFRYKDGADRKLCLNDDETEVTAPVNLAADGSQIANPTAANAIFLTFNVYNEQTFPPFAFI